MSVDWDSIVHDTDVSDMAEGMDVKFETSLEELGAEEWGDSDDGPPFERIVIDPEAAGDDEVGLTIEGKLEGVSADSMIGLATEDQIAERLVFDARSADENEVSISLEGRSEGPTVLFDAFTGDDTVFDRLVFDFQRGDEDEIGVSTHGRLDDASSTSDGENSLLQRLVIEPEGE